MESLHGTRKNYLVFMMTFFFILLFNVFSVTKLPIQDLAFMTMDWSQYIAIFLFGYLTQKSSFYPKTFKPFYKGIVIFTLAYTLIHFLTGDIETSSDLTQVLLVLVFVFVFAHIKWDNLHLESFAVLSVGLLLLLFIQWLYDGTPTFRFQSYIRNSNIFGIFVACLAYFPIVAFKHAQFWNRIFLAIGMMIALILIYVSSARAALLLLLIAICARLVLKLSRKAFYYLFHSIMLFNMIFVLVYGWMAKSTLFQSLNDWSVEYIGKRLFSGRQDIWEPALSYAFQKPFFGYYINILPKDYIPDTPYVHSHNQYLQLFLESGLIGLGCFVVLLFGIWKVYQKRLDSIAVRWSACFFLGILFYQSVEISLFFNMKSIGLIQWFIIAIGLGTVISNKKENY